MMKTEQITNPKGPDVGHAARPSTSRAARALRAFLIAGCAASFAAPAAFAHSGSDRDQPPNPIATTGPDEQAATCNLSQKKCDTDQSTASAAKSKSVSGDSDDQHAWAGAPSGSLVPGSLSARGHDHR